MDLLALHSILTTPDEPLRTALLSSSLHDDIEMHLYASGKRTPEARAQREAARNAAVAALSRRDGSTSEGANFWSKSFGG